MYSIKKKPLPQLPKFFSRNNVLTLLAWWLTWSSSTTLLLSISIDLLARTGGGGGEDIVFTGVTGDVVGKFLVIGLLL